MSDLSTAEQMMVQAYGTYLDKEKSLEFSTRDSYKTRLANYFKNQEQEQTPPHYSDAVEVLREYISKTSER